MKHIAVMLCLVVIISGCITIDNYKIKVGDELRVVIWKDLDEKVIVRPDQKISLPLIGEVSCKDKTPEELSSELTQKYETKTTVIVSKYHTSKDVFKEAITFIRDIAIVYFIGKRIADNKR